MKFSTCYFSIVLITVILFACDTPNNVDDPAESYFIKYFGGDGNQEGVDMLTLSDGSLMLLGTSEFGGKKSIYLVKTDSKGNIIWEKTYSGTSDVAIDIEPAQDNFVILARYEKSDSDHDVRLMLVSPDGNEINNVTYGMSQNKKEDPRSVTPLSDGGFIVTGSTQQDNSPAPPVNPDDYSNIFHFRCDSKLVFDNVTWSELYGAVDKNEVGIKSYEISPTEILIFAYSDNAYTVGQLGKYSPIYYKVGAGALPNSNPTVLGDFAQNIQSNSVIKVDGTLGGGFLVLATRSNSLGTITLQASKLKEQIVFDANRDEQFDEEISFVSNPVNAISATTSLTAPEGFLLLGEEVRTLGTKNISLTKIDQSAIVRWTVSLGSEEGNDRAAAVSELLDGKILVLGTVELGDNQSKMALFKLNSTGRLHD